MEGFIDGDRDGLEETDGRTEGLWEGDVEMDGTIEEEGGTEGVSDGV